MSKFNENRKLHIGIHSNTTRVRADKIPGLVDYINTNSHDIVNSGQKNHYHLIPFDIYQKFEKHFSCFDRSKDQKEIPALILYRNHDYVAQLKQRDKIFFHICPECKEEATLKPYPEHKDVTQCQCGEIFHESRDMGRRYI